MSYINKVLLTGNLTRDPELKVTQGGTQVLTFGIGVNEKRGGKDHPNFFECVVFGKYAEAMKPYLQKGQKVAIEGQLSYSSWEQDGHKRSKVEIVVKTIDTMGPAPARDAHDYAPGQQLPVAAAPRQVPDVYDEEIPF